MEYLTLFMLAVGLSMDAFAVALSDGLAFHDIKPRQTISVALSFGLFQALMPVLGFFLGQFVSSAISFMDHWIAFLLLGYIGFSMFTEAFRRPADGTPETVSFSYKTLFLQSVATSIDAFAAGIGFAMARLNIVWAALLIGAITFLCSLVGIRAGKAAGIALKRKAEAAGGILLFLIGLKILLEHLLS